MNNTYSAALLQLSNNKRIYCEDETNEFLHKRNSGIFNINIEKVYDKMNIKVCSESPVYQKEFINILCELMRFNMLFCGYFLHIDSITFISEGGKKENQNDTDLLFSYFISMPEIVDSRMELFCYPGMNEYSCMFNKWLKHEKEIDIIHPLFLYMISNNKLPVDIRNTFLLQVYEPLSNFLAGKSLINIVQLDKYTNGITFKDQLIAVFEVYGRDIFKKEFCNEKKRSELLALMVKSRNRIAHVDIKKKNHFTGKQCAIYNLKLYLLYRHIILQLLGVSYKKYEVKMTSLIKDIDLLLSE